MNLKQTIHKDPKLRGNTKRKIGENPFVNLGALVPSWQENT